MCIGDAQPPYTLNRDGVNNGRGRDDSLYHDLRATVADAPPDATHQTAGFYQPPRFHMSVLPEPEESGEPRGERRALATELFFDLVYVVPLTNLTSIVVGAESAQSRTLAKFVLYYLATATAWLGDAFFNTRFNADDATARVLTVFHTAGVVAMGYGIQHDSLSTFGAGYLWVRWILIVQYSRALVANYSSRVIRKVCTGLLIGFSVACMACMASVWLSKESSIMQLVFLSLALAIDTLTPFLLVALGVLRVGVHPTHMLERLTCYTIVVISVLLLESVKPIISLVHRKESLEFTPLCLFLATIVPFCLMTLYTSGLPSSLPGFTCSIWKRLRIYVWIYLHIPLTGCMIFTTTALRHLTACAHDPRSTYLTVPHAVGGIATILFLLGVHHSVYSGEHTGGIRPRGISRMCTGSMLMILIIPSDSISEQWYSAIIAATVTIQVLLEYNINTTSQEEEATITADSSPHDIGSSFDMPRSRESNHSTNGTTARARHLSLIEMGAMGTLHHPELGGARTQFEEWEEATRFMKQMYDSKIKQMQSRIHQLEEQLETVETAYTPFGVY